MPDNFLEQLGQISIDWFAMVTGIVGVWLSIKEKLLAWPLFICCYASYIYISYRSGLYAFSGMNAVFVGIAAYGWYNWANASRDTSDSGTQIAHMPARHWAKIAAFVALGTFAIGWLLSNTGEARLPYIDAFATCCAFTAQWMLSQKYVENWIFWIITDVIYTVFFFNDQIWPSVILFIVFIFLAIKGWREWRQVIRSNKPAS
ncbi:MAG: nicotinamide riboside transporter PnuC [Lentimonas sp.]